MLVIPAGTFGRYQAPVQSPLCPPEYTAGVIGQMVVPSVHDAAVLVDTFDTASAISVFPAAVAAVVTVAAAATLPRCTTVNGDTTAGDTAIIAPCTPLLEQVEVIVPVAPSPIASLSATR